MIETKLKLVVRTPRTVVLDRAISSLRVPTESGQVGLRLRVEPLVLAVEPGLVVIRSREEYCFVGTAGGLLRCDGRTATLLTPLAVTGGNENEVVETLETALQQPNAELEARATLSRLQSKILRELRERKKEQLRTLGDGQ